MRRFKKTYAKKETLLGLALGIYECASEVNECKSEVNNLVNQYLFQNLVNQYFPLEFQ